jgi:hypothetical protein
MATDMGEIVAALIAERQKAREVAFEQRRRSLAEFVADHKERRKHGLKRRHAAKLARNRAQERLAT